MTTIFNDNMLFIKNHNLLVHTFSYPDFKPDHIKYNHAMPSNAHVEYRLSTRGQLLKPRWSSTSDKSTEVSLLLKFNKYSL